jgi:hypothetical protein
VGRRAGLEGCGKSRPHGYSVPGPSSPWQVATKITLTGPICSCVIIINLHYQKQDVLFKQESFIEFSYCIKIQRPLNPIERKTSSAVL